MAYKGTQRLKKRDKKNIVSGVAHVNATFNNTMITITDKQGNAAPFYGFVQKNEKCLSDLLSFRRAYGY